MTEAFFTPAQVQVIRNHYQHVVDKRQRLSDEQFETGIAIAESKRLLPPPFGNHIYFMLRSSRVQGADGQWGDGPSVLTVQTGIDGYRVLAERTNKYVGSGVPTYEYGKDGFVSRAIIDIEKIAPDGTRCKVSADAWFDEYAQYTGFGAKRKLQKQWDEKPRLMLGKCCESLALRKAFPEPLSGLYTVEEMGGEAPAGPEDDVPSGKVKAQEESSAKHSCKESGHRLVEEGTMLVCKHCDYRTTGADPTTASAAKSSDGSPASKTSSEKTSQTSSTGASAPAAPSGTPSATTASTPADAPAPIKLASEEQKDKLVKALTGASAAFGISRAELVRLTREWANWPEAISDEGRVSKDLQAVEYENFVTGYKAWEAEKRASVKPRDAAVDKAEVERKKWEAEAGSEDVGEDEPAF